MVKESIDGKGLKMIDLKDFNLECIGFEAEFFKYCSHNDEIYGVVLYSGDWYSCTWSSVSGNMLNIASDYLDNVSEFGGAYNLTPTKEGWYKQDIFPCFVIDGLGGVHIAIDFEEVNGSKILICTTGHGDVKYYRPATSDDIQDLIANVK